MIKHRHFIGIGGIGMSALARILLKKGHRVTGSDLFQSQATQMLELEGATVYYTHDPKHIKGADAVIYSTDIPQDNLEVDAARKAGIPILHRSELIAELLEGYAPLLVTGTHGKTTTVSLLAHLLVEAGLDPSYAIGGYLNGVNTNSRSGKGLYFAVEADESDGSFLKYPSFGAIITNLESDHIDYWKTEEALHVAFKHFASQVASKQHLFWCQDDVHLCSLNLEGYSFGFSEKADLVINNFHHYQWTMIFDVSFEGRRYIDIEIPLIGAHNILNATAAFGLGLKLDIKEDVLRQGLKSFQGIGRRVEKKGGTSHIEIYDDYAHHPTEIFATLRALHLATHGRRIVVAFQPHRYSRTQHCMDDFADAFEYADHVVLTDIYAAREDPIPRVTPKELLKRIQGGGYQSVSFVCRDQLTTYLAKYLKEGDVLITMGAGDITCVGPQVFRAIEDEA